MVARAAYNWTSQPHAWLDAEIAGTERWVVVATWQETPSAHAA